MNCWFFSHHWDPWEVTERLPFTVRSLDDPQAEARVVGRVVYQERKCVLCGKVQIRKAVAR